MTTNQHKSIGRASRHLLYAIKWLEKATSEHMSDKELKRIQIATELVRKAIDKL